MSHAGKKVLSHGRDLIRPSERGLDRLDRQKGYVAQAERRHNPDKTKNNVNIRKNDRKEANLVMSLYCQFPAAVILTSPIISCSVFPFSMENRSLITLSGSQLTALLMFFMLYRLYAG